MADEKRMPNVHEASSFRSVVLEAAAAWLDRTPALDRSCFNVDVEVSHTAVATEDLSQYFARSTGDEMK